MIDRVTGNKPLPAEHQTGHYRAHRWHPAVRGGNDEGGIGSRERKRALRSPPQFRSLALLGVPASLHASLMARLDRLGPAKDVAQVGAAIGREFSHLLLAAVVTEPEAELQSALDRLMTAGLLFRQGAPPHATYLFKHALVQDAAYGTLLREPRRALHARIAETLENQFAEIAESQPELLARHCTEAGLIEKAGLWGKAGQRSLERSALVEAVAAAHPRARADYGLARHTRAASRADQAAGRALNPAPTCERTLLRRKPERRRAATSLIEQAEALGEPPEDPLLLFSVLYGFWVANLVAFNGDVLRELAAQFLALAEKQAATVPLWSGIASWALPCCTRETSRKAERTTIRAWCFTILPNIVRWRRDLAIDARVSILSIARWLCGRLAIPRPRSQTQTTRSRKPATSAKLPL